MVTVVCEGKTERNYLERIHDEAGQDSRFVLHFDPHAQPGKGFKPAEAVDRAIDVQHRTARSAQENEEEEEENSGPEQYVWAVFDRDQHNDVDEAIRRAHKNGVEVAFSTPSFDLWLLLHFASGPPANVSSDNKLLVRRLNAVQHFERYGRSSGGKGSDSKPKILNEAQLTALWTKRGNAVRLARQLVDRCSSGRCRAATRKAERGHDPTCDPLKRDTQTDFYRLLELLGVDDRDSAAGRRGRG
ncbi:RloB family protein [Actinomadura sp.]|uniref:RloB family protein n=1 Tax=Actinomadura sp. TaxID=1989 RepID=UPI00335C4328